MLKVNKIIYIINRFDDKIRKHIISRIQKGTLNSYYFYTNIIEHLVNTFFDINRKIIIKIYYKTLTQKIINFYKFHDKFIKLDNKLEKINYELTKFFKKKFNDKLFNK